MSGILGRPAWERMNGALWLPSVHYIGKNGSAKDCCHCTVFDGTPPTSVDILVEGVGTGPCLGCANLNIDVEDVTQSPEESFDYFGTETAGGYEYCWQYYYYIGSYYGNAFVWSGRFFRCPSLGTRSAEIFVSYNPAYPYCAYSRYVRLSWGGYDVDDVDPTAWDSGGEFSSTSGSLEMTIYKYNPSACDASEASGTLSW